MTLSNVISFVTAHETILVGLGVAIGDLLIALNPNIDANGIFHAVYLFLKGKQNPPDVPPAA